MTIAKGKVVSLHYTLHDVTSGDEIERSHGAEPMAYLHGYSNIIAGLEEALEGKNEGDKVDVTITPEKGYGERNEGETQRLSRKYLKPGKLQVGQQVTVSTDQGNRVVTILKVGLKTVDVDVNHPLAGKTLRFVVDIVAVRDASDEEIQHGHAHGVGGHQH